MRSFRRPPRPEPPLADVTLEGVVALIAPSRSNGAGPPDSGEWAAGARYDLQATDRGLIIGCSSDAKTQVPDLVPWSAVSSVSAEAVTELPDGSWGEVLELAAIDGGWPGGNRVQRFAAPAPGLGAFLVTASSRRRSVQGSDPDASEVSGGSVGHAVGALAVIRAFASRWAMPRHESGDDPFPGVARHRGPIIVAVLALVLLGGSTSTSLVSSASGASGRSRSQAADQGNRDQASRAYPVVKLPAATSAPAPAPPSLTGSPPLQSHEMFGYAPYWTLPQSSGFDVKDLTTLAYFSVDANPDGTLDESGSGWNGYESQDLVNLVNRSHAAGDRVVLTVTDFSQSNLDAITSDPNAGGRLSAALIAAVSAKNLDGVNFDFEGEGSGDRQGLTSLITQVSGALHGANPHWQVTMATYASAAADSSGFYDVAALAPAIDAFFVMAYDMNDTTTPSATAPLVGGGYNDTEAIQQFTAVVPAQKVILGVPYYGYDWPTTDGSSTAQATGSESPLSDGVIAASGHPTYWDPSTMTAWTSYQVGTQWHETYFDNPTSLALKAQLANSNHIGGVGIWALGMDGNNPAMLAALLGNAAAAKDYQTGPTTTSPSASSTTTPTGPPGAGYTTTGTWNGTQALLIPVTPPTSEGSAQYLGTLSQFTTTDPSLACLQSGPPLSVWSFTALPGVDVVVASQPQDCAGAMWTFSAPSATTSSAGSSPTTTTTTTRPVSPTTTTTSTTTTPTTTTTTTKVPPTTTTTTTTTTTLPPGP